MDQDTTSRFTLEPVGVDRSRHPANSASHGALIFRFLSLSLGKFVAGKVWCRESLVQGKTDEITPDSPRLEGALRLTERGKSRSGQATSRHGISFAVRLGASDSQHLLFADP
mgnify:FL=1